jgi:hypothetical protein
LRPSIRLRRFGAPLVLAALLALPGACRRAEPGLDPAAARYTVRGEVVAVDDGPSGRVLVVRHEAVPDFVDATGARTRMASMAMPFQVGAAARDAVVRQGDRIRFRFAVDWKANRIEIESIEPLPAGTALELGR